MTDVPTEFWIVQSETHLPDGENSLAYWGPFTTHAEAAANDMYTGAETIIEIPAGASETTA